MAGTMRAMAKTMRTAQVAAPRSDFELARGCKSAVLTPPPSFGERGRG
jgi:hypothetical protein